MADIETRESNLRNDSFASLTDSDLDKLLLEEDAANTRKKAPFSINMSWLDKTGFFHNAAQMIQIEFSCYWHFVVFFFSKNVQSKKTYDKTIVAFFFS